MSEFDWKAKAGNWVFQQGVSTVLLLLVLYVVWTAWPTAIKTIQSGYDRNADQLEQAATRTEKTVDRLLNVIQGQYAEQHVARDES